ncbi:MAG: hypothetical protein ACLFQB_06990, partial [Chitinispirillaceae bacterium]
YNFALSLALERKQVAEGPSSRRPGRASSNPNKNAYARLAFQCRMHAAEMKFIIQSISNCTPKNT